MANRNSLRSASPAARQPNGGWPERAAWTHRPTIVHATARRSFSVTPGRPFDCFCASSLEQVLSAWQLVYRRYVEMELIHENSFGIHTTPMAVGRQACVICGSAGGGVHTTMTLITDTAQGLPLDSVYAPYLDGLRQKGRRLLEVGLLADRRRNHARGISALFLMMRWAAYYTLHSEATDMVIGVHPHHTPFYERYYGFERFAATADYPLVRNNPVVPLRLRVQESLARNILPRGLVAMRDNPVAADAFAQRFEFKPEQVDGSPIAAFLQAANQPVRDTTA